MSICRNTVTSTPRATPAVGTTMRLPMVWLLPVLVVRAGVWITRAGSRWAPSLASTAGVLQVQPLSMLRLASMALTEPARSGTPLKARRSMCRVPSGPMSTQKSDARSNSPHLPVPAPPQRDMRCKVRVQVNPPLLLTALTSARAPPLLQRACCRAASSRLGLAGWIAAKGSTSAFAKLMPLTPAAPGATPVRHAVTGDTPLATPASLRAGHGRRRGGHFAATATATATATSVHRQQGREHAQSSQEGCAARRSARCHGLGI